MSIKVLLLFAFSLTTLAVAVVEHSHDQKAHHGAAHLRRQHLHKHMQAHKLHASSKQPDMNVADDDGDDDDDDDSVLDAQEAADRTQARAAKEAQLQQAITKANADLLDNVKTQERYNAEMLDLEQPKQSRVIDANVVAVANETQSPALANMLGDMWKELRTFAAPEHLEFLEGEMKSLTAERPGLEASLEQAKANLTEQRNIWAAEDAAMQPVVAETTVAPTKAPTQPPTQAIADPAAQARSPDGKYVSQYTRDTMPGVSTTMVCVASLTWQLFIVHTALAVVRTLNQMKAKKWLWLQKILETVCSTVAYAPMLCVLFIATRMRALHITQGQPEAYGLPEPWVENMMYTSTFAHFAQIILVCAMGFEAPRIDLNTNIEDDVIDTTGQGAPKKNQKAEKMLGGVGFLITFVLNVSIAAVCYGAVTMPIPQSLWGEAGVPTSTPLWCSFLLSFVFFAVGFGQYFFMTIRYVNDTHPKSEECFSLAKDVMNLAPMLCILFYASRLRVLQIFPEEAAQQAWAKRCQVTCSVALVAKVFFTLVIPMSDAGAKRKKGTSAGEAMYVLSSHSLKIVSAILRGCLVILIYSGALAITVSIFTISSPEGPASTPPISDTVACIITVQNVYFAVYLSVYVIHTVRDFLPTKKVVHKLVGIFEAGRYEVSFAPILCLLMLSTRMRALQLTRTVNGSIPPAAAPQFYVTEAMHIATWAIVVSMVMTYLSCIFLGTGVNFQEDWQGATPKGLFLTLTIFDIVKYVCIVFLYYSVIAMIYGAYNMSPDVLPPYVAA